MIPFFDGNGYLIYLAGVAGLLHACLQLPLATLLHMAGHTLGRNQPGKALALSFAMAFGVFLTIVGLLLIAILITIAIPDPSTRFLLAGIPATLAGLWLMLGYFRNENGAQLWLPRRHARWFNAYIERRHSLLSAFSLGNLSVLLEAGFSFPLLLSAAALLSGASTQTVFIGFGVYAAIAALPLLLTAISLAAGATPLALQRWRLEGKRFWQFFIGLAFIFFGLYIASEQFVYNATALGVL